MPNEALQIEHPILQSVYIDRGGNLYSNDLFWVTIVNQSAMMLLVFCDVIQTEQSDLVLPSSNRKPLRTRLNQIYKVYTLY